MGARGLVLTDAIANAISPFSLSSAKSRLVEPNAGVPPKTLLLLLVAQGLRSSRTGAFETPETSYNRIKSGPLVISIPARRAPEAETPMGEIAPGKASPGNACRAVAVPAFR